MENDVKKEDSVEKKEKKKIKFKFGLKLLKKIIYCIVLALAILLLFSKCSKTRVKLDSSSNLISIEEIEKFNLAKFDWTGIAEYYKKGEEKTDTFIKYDAIITASMNMKNFNENNFLIDRENKKIYITLPKIELKPTILFKKDGESFSFIPEKTEIEMKDIIEVCEKDAINKANERVKLLDIAKENAKSTFEGLLLPLIEEENYTIIWKDGE